MTRLCIYRNSDRELLYDGDPTDPRIELRPPTHVVVDGRQHRVVNTHSDRGYLGLWVTA